MVLYPNPARDLLIIEAETNEEYSVGIISVKGQLIYGSEGLRFPQQIDLSPIPNGTYFLRIRSKDFVMTRKIIKL